MGRSERGNRIVSLGMNETALPSVGSSSAARWKVDSVPPLSESGERRGERVRHRNGEKERPSETDVEKTGMARGTADASPIYWEQI